MAQWRVRDPGSFPPAFHDAIQAGPGEDKLVSRRFTEQAVRSDQTQWQIFRFSLRHYPQHASAKAEASFRHRTRVRFNQQSKMWELLLTTHPPVFQDLIGMG